MGGRPQNAAARTQVRWGPGGPAGMSECCRTVLRARAQRRPQTGGRASRACSAGAGQGGGGRFLTIELVRSRDRSPVVPEQTGRLKRSTPKGMIDCTKRAGAADRAGKADRAGGLASAAGSSRRAGRAAAGPRGAGAHARAPSGGHCKRQVPQRGAAFRVHADRVCARGGCGWIGGFAAVKRGRRHGRRAAARAQRGRGPGRTCSRSGPPPARASLRARASAVKQGRAGGACTEARARGAAGRWVSASH